MSSLDAQARLEARVTGRVQGVGFRQFVRYHARRLGLTGWVRNEPDGSVYLVAEGPRELLEQLLDVVRQGPPAARVDEVQVHWLPARGEFEAFEIRWW
ncbi:acylphosphatase [Rhodothermus marinus]|uniref:acylphosphatase n=1 Tax=Rhodothermus marinus TaxID=29549 RepID=UPI0037CA9257